MDRYDDEDDYLPPPKKSGASAVLMLGIVLGAVLLLGLLIVVCGGAFFLARDAGPVQPPRPTRQESGVMDKGGPATKPAPPKGPQPDGMKAKLGPPAGPDK
jgi:hypothetical protein